MTDLSTIDLDTLATVAGGSKATSLVLDKLNSRFGSQGVVSFDGRPTVSPTKRPGIDTVSGKFDTNALWGGDTTRSFRGTVNLNTNSVTGLHTHILGSK